MNEQSEMILNQAELTIETGERLMLLGANGVGKTTLLKLLARRLPLYQGSLSSPTFKNANGVILSNGYHNMRYIF